MKAAVVRAFNEPLRIEDRPVPAASHGQVQLHAEGRTRVIRESRQLEDVNESFEQIEKGGVDARLLFDFRQ